MMYIPPPIITQVREAALELGYQPDEMFLLKISQLRELFVVRWSVFLLGPAGCGKTAIWRTLMKAQLSLGEKTIYRPVNPKVYMHAKSFPFTNVLPQIITFLPCLLIFTGCDT